MSMIGNLRDRAIAGILADAAMDSIGVYPQSVSGGSKPYKKRTQWMEGWNAYGTELIERQCAVSRFFNSLGEPEKTHLGDLLLNGTISIHTDSKGNCKFYVNCSDLFYWACADAEDLEISDLPDLLKAIEDCPERGGELWCCRKRRMRPQPPCYRDISPDMAVLFDACGPPRDPKECG